MKARQRAALGRRLAGGERKTLGAAVARDVLDDPALVAPLIDCLDGDDAAVVSHAAHAVMRIGRDAPALVAPYADRLLAVLAAARQWEIGEQLPKVIVALPLTGDQTGLLADILVRQTGNPSNIAAASALSGLADLATKGRIEQAVALREIERALKSPRKALAARARRLVAASKWLRNLPKAHI